MAAAITSSPSPWSRTERLAWIGSTIATAIAWQITWIMARSMGGEMPVAGGWRMSMMCMMVAMMLLSAMPVLMIARQAAQRAGRSGSLWIVAAAGYFASWTLFGLGVYVLGRVTADAAMKFSGLASAMTIVTAATITAAGIYQLTPLKKLCLKHCQSPMLMMANHWRADATGAFRTGFHHGNYCVACCWPLMAVQCILGIMNIPLMVLVATVIAAEKLMRRSRPFTIAAGLVMVVGGAAMFVQHL